LTWSWSWWASSSLKSPKWITWLCRHDAVKFVSWFDYVWSSTTRLCINPMQENRKDGGKVSSLSIALFKIWDSSLSTHK
jgi:hypothetical protein